MILKKENFLFFYLFFIHFFLLNTNKSLLLLKPLHKNSFFFLKNNAYNTFSNWIDFLSSFKHSLFFIEATRNFSKSRNHSYYFSLLKKKKYIRWNLKHKKWWWSLKNIFLSAQTLAFYIRSEFTKNKSLSKVFNQLRFSIPFNVKGFLIILRGRPSGVPRASTKKIKMGCLHFTKSLSNIDFFFLKIQNRFGVCGLKIWINTIHIN